MDYNRHHIDNIIISSSSSSSSSPTHHQQQEEEEEENHYYHHRRHDRIGTIDEFLQARNFVLSVKQRFACEGMTQQTYRAFLDILYDFQQEEVGMHANIYTLFLPIHTHIHRSIHPYVRTHLLPFHTHTYIDA